MKYLGYIGIGSTIVLLNLWKVYSAGIDYFDVCMAAILTMWVVIAGIAMFGGIPYNLSQSLSVIWLGVGLLWDLIQEALGMNTGSANIEVIIFLLGIIAIHVFIFIKKSPLVNGKHK